MRILRFTAHWYTPGWYAVVAISGAACAAAGQRSGGLTPAAASVTTIHDVGFNQPENLVYDSVADLYLVSNMGGGNAARDDNGFISRVAPDGRVVKLRWIAGGVGGARLDAPKGLAIRGDTLAVADIGGVHFFDRRTGRPLRTQTLPGLVFNDLAYGADGSLWITDTGPDRTSTPIDTSKDLDAVWRVSPRGQTIAVARGLALDRPDGIVLDGTGAIIATFGADRLERVGGGTPGRWSTVVSLPGGRVDGLRRLPDGSLVTSSWDRKTVWRLDANHVPHTLLTGVTSPAGLAVDTRRHRLAVTSMQGNAMYLLPLP
jgi:hypothetical protein